ncbi:MAG: carboxypeptidase-like regulatory domain-containing protein [Pyrinomonadaceae bacterium]
MFRKNYLGAFLPAVVLFVACSSAFAQNVAPVRGIVKLQKADGTLVPVVDAVVEAYRTDIEKGKMQPAKTNKRGEFSFVGFPLGQRYVLAVSGPGVGPRIQPEVKGGMENISFVVNEGDGHQLTEAEVRTAVKATADVPASGEMTEAQKKERAELERKNAEITVSNKKAEDTNKVVNTALQAGAASFNTANYDAAIAEFDKGIAADPDFAGSAPVLLNYKGVAHAKRAIATYKASASGDATAKAAAIEKMKPDLSAALVAYESGLDILKKASPAAAAPEQKNRETARISLLANSIEAYGLSARFAPDPAKAARANTALDEYFAAEPDQAKRMTTVLGYANNMNGAGELKLAASAYRKVLEMAPDNLDALVGLGLALYSEGSTTTPPDKVVLQEGLNYMQKFVDVAPNTHPLKESTKQIIDELKNEQKLAPQKTAPAKRKG